ncbi:hypothetical protein LX64_04390 [Chitinophaga skermanii]|uniref:Copper chaperone CopZ n=1 Tax=Chitinophaga skermanii TaxID=331697 RepID=A0A327Q7Q9_9BACT|nr:hypothetical protein [Chitinophaga skermanii]RAI99837.1 hypothetical protein LX64_04390 [Chitinophaga skermanii]
MSNSNHDQPAMQAVGVFKTSLQNTGDVLKVKPALDKHPQIQRWNVALDDEDKILRVVTSSSHYLPGIATLLHAAGYACEELVD